ncbi:MAG: Gfo/Idh/MocA family oxidoreductase, partial [Chloroflexota bacterium]
MPDDATFRFGLAGTGYWATETHAAGIADVPGARLAAVWGRDGAAASALAARHGGTGFDDFDAFLAQVDAVSFAVPPDVQPALALRAAAAGKHVLLEKPMALDEATADQLVQAVDASGVAALVFFTHLFSPPAVAWFEEVDANPWLGGDAYWLGSALADENPFNTPWRRRYGGLWDVGPHAVVDLWRTLGPVVRVTAELGAPDVTHLVLHHERGISSTSTLTLSAPDAADGFTMLLWGPAGRTSMPIDDVDSRTALTVAA